MLRTLSSYAASLVGLAFFCAMLRAPFFGSVVAGDVPEPAMLRFLYDTSMIALGVALTFLGVTRFACGLDDRGIKVTVLLGSTAVVGMAVINACRLLGVGALAPYLFGVVLVSIGFFAIAALWFQRMADLPRDAIAVLVLAAFVVSHLSCLVDMLPRSTAAVVTMAYPLGSMIAFLHAQAKESHDEGHLACANDGQSGSERYVPDAYFRKIRSLALTLIVAELACGAFLRSRWAHGGVGYDPSINAIFTYLVSAVIGLLLIVVMRRSKSASEASLVIGSAGMAVFVLATAAFAFSPISLLAPVVTGLYSALLVYMMALIALWLSDGDCSSVTCAGAFVLLYGTISGLTSTVIPVLLSFRGIMPDVHLAAVGTVAGLTISMGVCVVLFNMVVLHRESYLDELARAGLSGEQGDDRRFHAGDGPAMIETDPVHERAMDAIADTFGLTKRERETASLISRGYTAKRVADELCLTPGTVQGYAKSVYRKMGIHRKDELIEMVFQARGGL